MNLLFRLINVCVMCTRDFFCFKYSILYLNYSFGSRM